MVERQGGGNAAGVVRVTPAAPNYPATLTEPPRREYSGTLCFPLPNSTPLSPFRPAPLLTKRLLARLLGLSFSSLAVLGLPLANTNIYSWVRK